MKNVIIDLEQVSLFRRAESKDIYTQNVVYILGDDKDLIEKIIEKVLNTFSEFKAFLATDGCRYGLCDLYVIKTGTELQQKINELENKLKKIEEILNF